MSEPLILKAVSDAAVDSGKARIGVALSGGLDSMVLAESLRRLQIPFVALHINHGWRGKQSDDDAAWVKAWCSVRALPYAGKKLGSSVQKTEAAGREARLAFYRSAGAKKGLGEIWLAHHADDLVETFLIQLIRGAGPEGLASMPERRSLGDLMLVRPLLGCRKAELKAAAKAWKLEWREDSSNRSGDYLRNRVRRGLLPYLKKIAGRDTATTLARCARIISGENAHWDGLLPKIWTETLSCAELLKNSMALQRRMIRAWLLSRHVADLSFEDIELVRGLLSRDKPAKINLSRGRHCRRRNGVLFID